MKKLFFFLAALVLGAMAASVNAQTLSSSTVDVRYCFTTQGSETVSELCRDSYIWVDASGRKADTTITTFGTHDYVRTLINARGCDSIATLHLTLEDHRTSEEHNIEVCTGEPLVFNNETIEASPETGVYHAYSTNAAGCEHDDILNVTVTPCYPVGAASGHVFSVAANKKVYFSKGNLVYSTSGTRTCNDEKTKAGTFSFADNQHDAGSLFVYGASGYTVSPTANFTSLSEQTIKNTNNDWGVYNPITNGGNQPNLWRTIAINELKYIIQTRTDAANKVGVGTVVDAEGLILLPDDWTECPMGCSFTPYSSETENCAYNTNVYNAEQWALMEAAGAVFFYGAPAGTTTGSTNSYYYWYSASYVFIVSLGNKLTTRVWGYTVERSTSMLGTSECKARVRLVMDMPAE